MDQHESTGSREVRADGIVYEVVWAGDIVNTVSGVKGGLMHYPHYEQTPEPDPPPPAENRPKYAIPCLFCRQPMNKPPWLAHRHPYCGRTCALRARHARQRAARAAVDPSSPSS